MSIDPGPASTPALRLSPWRFVVSFGVISLLSDVVYEGARAVTGPLLAGLGATALVVGVVTGAGKPPRWYCASGPESGRTEPGGSGDSPSSATP